MNADPDAIDLWRWIGAAFMGIIAWLWKGHENRLKQLEITAVLKADADAQRQALRDEVKEFRGEVSGKLELLRVDTNEKRVEASRSFETHRIETNIKLEKLSDQMTDLIGRVGTAKRRTSKA